MNAERNLLPLLLAGGRARLAYERITTTVRVVAATGGRSSGGRKFASESLYVIDSAFMIHRPELISVPLLGRHSPRVGNHAAHAVR